MPKFKLVLEKTYWNTGFFNVKADYDGYLGRSQGAIDKVLGNSGVTVTGRIDKHPIQLHDYYHGGHDIIGQ